MTVLVLMCGIHRTGARVSEIALGSPRRLNLHLHCTARRPQAVVEPLDIWQDLPIAIKLYSPPRWGVDDTVAAAALEPRLHRSWFQFCYGIGSHFRSDAGSVPCGAAASTVFS
jgi:hypothetical protein